MEIYAEQSVSNPLIDQKQRRTKVLNYVKSALLIILVIVTVVYFFIPIFDTEKLSVGMFFLATFLMYFVIATPFVLGMIFISRYISKTNVEFDYFINGDIFRIVRVVNRKKRKLFIEIRVSAFESVGRITIDSYDRLADDKNIKKHYALCAPESDDDVVFIYYHHENEKHLLHIEPNEDFIISLRRSLPRVSIADKSILVPLKKD